MKQLAKRLLRLAFVLIAVTALTFITLDLLPGDIAEYMTGDESSLEDIEAIREDLGLNKNILVRYGEWLKNAARGDLGKSLRTEQPVAEAILSRLPVTLELIAISLFISLALAVPAGILSAYREGTWIDKTLNCIAFSGSSIPVFIMGILFIYLFALKLSWLPATGYIPLSDGFFCEYQNLYFTRAEPGAGRMGSVDARSAYGYDRYSQRGLYPGGQGKRAFRILYTFCPCP